MTKNQREWIGKRPDNRPLVKTLPKNVRQEKEIMAQIQKLKAEGLIGNRSPVIWLWTLEDKQGSVEALTKSEARAKIKSLLKLPKKKRLPKELIIIKEE